jgi:hypothetical protein
VTATATGRHDHATAYRRADEALAAHMATCQTCRTSNCGCPSGDDAATREARAYSAWYAAEPIDARSYTRYQEPLDG